MSAWVVTDPVFTSHAELGTPNPKQGGIDSNGFSTGQKERKFADRLVPEGFDIEQTRVKCDTKGGGEQQASNKTTRAREIDSQREEGGSV